MARCSFRGRSFAANLSLGQVDGRRRLIAGLRLVGLERRTAFGGGGLESGDTGDLSGEGRSVGGSEQPRGCCLVQWRHCGVLGWMMETLRASIRVGQQLNPHSTQNLCMPRYIHNSYDPTVNAALSTNTSLLLLIAILQDAADQ